MKKKFIIALLAIIACFACGCSNGFVSELEFNEYNSALSVGETKQLTAIGDDLKWNSSDEQIVSVTDTGLITALKVGNADITVTSGTQSKSVTIYVIDAGIPQLVLDNSDKYVQIGKSFKLPYGFILDGEPVSKTASFESLDKNIATVDNDGTITGVNTGKTVIRIKYSISVKGENFEFYKDVNVIVNPSGIFILDKTDVSLVVKTLSGENSTSATVSVKEAVFDGADQMTVVWKSANEKVAKVDNGHVKSVGAGQTVITATVLGNEIYTANVNVTVGKEKVILNEKCYADVTTNLGSDVKTEYAQLYMPTDSEFYGNILSVKKTTGIEVEMKNGNQLLTQSLNFGNNNLIFETEDFEYQVTVNCGSSFAKLSSYELIPWELTKGTTEVGMYHNKENVLKTQSQIVPATQQKPADYESGTAYDVYYNNVGIWNLSANNLFGNSGYICFDLFLDKPTSGKTPTQAGFYINYEGNTSKQNNIARLLDVSVKTPENQNPTPEYQFVYRQNERTVIDNVVKVVDSNYNVKPGGFKYGEWNKILVNVGCVDNSIYNTINFIPSFVNNVHPGYDGPRTAYYANFTFISEKQFYNITDANTPNVKNDGQKTVCYIDNKANLLLTNSTDTFTFDIKNSCVKNGDVRKIWFNNSQINDTNSLNCNITDVKEGDILELVVETDYKLYNLKAIVGDKEYFTIDEQALLVYDVIAKTAELTLKDVGIDETDVALIEEVLLDGKKINVANTLICNLTVTENIKKYDLVLVTENKKFFITAKLTIKESNELDSVIPDTEWD